jgi:hypothetical protein
MFIKQILAALATSAVIATGADAAPLQIDFSTVAGGQSGWETINGTGSPSGTFSGYSSLGAGNITVSLSNIEFNRLYKNGTSGPFDDFPGTDLDAMYGDLLFRNDNGATVDVTISGLQAGTFQITTHHLIATPNPGDFDLFVQDADNPGFGQFVGNFDQGTGSTTTFNPNVITFDVFSNGVDDIILRMEQGTPTTGGNTGGWFGFNGLEIAAVPEPTSVACWSILGLGLGYYRLRRKK